jgi:Zn-finger nucleic acid-binding protein
MPAQRRTLRCPVCRGTYIYAGRLENHIEQEHPEYHHQRLRETRRQHSDYRNAIDSAHNAHRLPYNASKEDNSASHTLTPEFVLPNDIYNPPDSDLPLFGQNHDPVPMLLDNPHREVISIGEEYTRETRTNRGSPLHYVESEPESSSNNARSSFYPFVRQSHFNFADWLIRANVSKSAIDELFDEKAKMPLDPSLAKSFKSDYTLRQRIHQMEDNIGQFATVTTDMTWNSEHKKKITFKYRNPIDCAKWLLRQPYYAEHMIYNATRLSATFEENGEEKKRRVFDEMSSGDWWWETEVSIDVNVQN